MEWKKNKIFGMIAFISYGLFWDSLIFLMILPETGLAVAPSNNSLGVYMLIWAVFSFGMFVATLAKGTRALSVLFMTVVIFYVLLAIHYFTSIAVVT
jgi:succinate-acetate transporter protein